VAPYLGHDPGRTHGCMAERPVVKPAYLAGVHCHSDRGKRSGDIIVENHLLVNFIPIELKKWTKKP
jgi:hypothetical protein